MSSGRSCGPCRACCVTPPIDSPELKKKQHVACSHLRVAGCSIYKTRPDVCRGFNCMWLNGELPRDARPDKLGVIFELRADPENGKRHITAREMTPGAADFPEVQRLITWLAPWLDSGDIIEVERY